MRYSNAFKFRTQSISFQSGSSYSIAQKAQLIIPFSSDVASSLRRVFLDNGASLSIAHLENCFFFFYSKSSSLIEPHDYGSSTF